MQKKKKKKMDLEYIIFFKIHYIREKKKTVHNHLISFPLF